MVAISKERPQYLMYGIVTAIALPIAYYGVLWILTGFAMSGYIWDETTYSAGYNEKLFNKLKVGDSQAYVQALIGKPLFKQKWDDNEGWFYSKKGPYGWRKRSVIFRDHKVQEIVSEWEPG